MTDMQATAAPEEVVDMTGVNARDVDLVVAQTGCLRSRAAKALRTNDNDIILAIMEITM
jgi:nascent polypeptide-associated complex subunit alpha